MQGNFKIIVWGGSPHPTNIHSYGGVTIAGEGLQMFSYTRHSDPIEQWEFLSVPKDIQLYIQ